MKIWKHCKVFGILAILVIVLGFIACDNGNNNDPPKTPTANAGIDFEHNITENGATVVLNGSGTNGTFSWACTNTPTGAATPVFSNSAIAAPTVSGFNKLGEYEFTLTVSGSSDSASDAVKVTLYRLASTTLYIAANSFSSTPGAELDFTPTYTNVSNPTDFTTATINGFLTYTITVVNHDGSYTNTWNSTDTGFNGKILPRSEYEIDLAIFTQTFYNNGVQVGTPRVLQAMIAAGKFEYFGVGYGGSIIIPAINDISISRKITEGNIP
jgi:hypothetical protein